jgi:ubiquinol-cytochrome c reductase iron-sulfur subunit
VSDPSDRPAASHPGHEPDAPLPSGHQGEAAWEAQGNVLDRDKHPVPTDGRDIEPGERAQASGVLTADSSISPATGVGDVASQGPSGAQDVDRRRERRAERVVGCWFLVSVVGTLAFVVMDLIGNEHRQYYTPALGVFMAVAVGALGIGLIHWAKTLMGNEEAVQEREPHSSPPEEVEAAERAFARGVQTSGILRRPIIRRTLLMAAGALGLIGVVPILNLGPLVGRKPKALGETSWRETQPLTDASGKSIRGVRMIDQTGRAIKLGDISAGGLLTVFPGIQPVEGKPGFYEVPSLQVKGDSTVLLIRLRPGDLPGRNAENTYFDHIAFSKICTHAGCPVSLYEQQTHRLLCPCHQSIFDVTDRGRPLSGPASRPLPQLAITVDSEGYFIAKGDFSQPVGPTYWERG